MSDKNQKLAELSTLDLSYNHFIQTMSGVCMDPMAPSKADFRWADIAHALGNMCRYVGHCSRFYSVAEHSVAVSHQAERVVRERYGNEYCKLEMYDLYVARWGLIHDASEAYLSDVSTPVKKLPEMKPYRDAEEHLQGMIAQWAGLGPNEPPEVKEADTQLFAT